MTDEVRTFSSTAGRRKSECEEVKYTNPIYSLLAFFLFPRFTFSSTKRKMRSPNFDPYVFSKSQKDQSSNFTSRREGPGVITFFCFSRNFFPRPGQLFIFTLLTFRHRRKFLTFLTHFQKSNPLIHWYPLETQLFKHFLFGRQPRVGSEATSTLEPQSSLVEQHSFF